MSWDDLITTFEERGITPEDIAEMIYYYEVNHGVLDSELMFVYNGVKSHGGDKRD